MENTDICKFPLRNLKRRGAEKNRSATLDDSPEVLVRTGGCRSRLAGAVGGARHEDRVDGVDDAVVALDVRRPVGGLGRALGLEADDGAVEPVLAELAVRREGAAVERLLVRVEGVHRLLALDHVVLEHGGVDRRADLVVVLVEVVELSSVTGSEDSTETSSAKGSADEHEIKIKANKVNKYFLIGL